MASKLSSLLKSHLAGPAAYSVVCLPSGGYPVGTLET